MNENESEALHSSQAEVGLLGSILLDSTRVLALCADLGVKTDSFYDEKHRVIYTELLAMQEAGVNIDMLTLSSRLKDASKLEGKGKWWGYLEKIMDATPTAAYAEKYADIVVMKRMSRSLVELSYKMRNSALDTSLDPEFVRAQYETHLTEIADTSVKSGKLSFKDVVDAGKKIWVDAANGVSVGIETGIPYIDNDFGGLMPKCLLIISGPPGSAKSTMMRCILESLSQRGVPCALTTTEQSSIQMTQAMVAAEAGVTVSSMNRHGGNLEALPAIANAAETVKAWPITDISEDIPTRSQLVSWAYRQIAKGAKVIFLDFIQDVVGDGTSEETDEQRVTRNISACRRVAKRTGIPWVIIASENYAGTMRYSRQIESDAWVWLQIAKASDHDAMHNPAYDVKLRKARFSAAIPDYQLYWHYGRMLTGDKWTEIKNAMEGKDPHEVSLFHGAGDDEKKQQPNADLFP